MALRESIDRQPFRYLISGIVAATSISVGIITFLMNEKEEIATAKHELAIEKITQDYDQTTQEYEYEISDLKRRMASVRAHGGQELEFTRRAASARQPAGRRQTARTLRILSKRPLLRPPTGTG